MEMYTRTAEQFATISWAGGDTTELFIYPPDGSYADRNFIFRISSATILDGLNTFTRLPGIRRKLLVLEGQLRLRHNGKAGKWLLSNAQEEFLGDWNTVSEGTGIDYNLMLQGDAVGEISLIQLLGQDKENCVIYLGEHKKCFLFLYVWEGQITIEDGYEKQMIKEKELAVFEIGEETKVSGFLIENQLNTKARFIKTEVYL